MRRRRRSKQRFPSGGRVSVVPFAHAEDAGTRLRGTVVELRGGCILLVDGDDGERRWFPVDSARRLKDRHAKR